jgi:hypothetical protein
MLLGRANSAGAAATSLTTRSTGNSLKVVQAGTGAGVYSSVVGASRAAVQGTNLAPTSGTGSAITAEGQKNVGLAASTTTTARQAIRAQNRGGGTGLQAGVAVRATAGMALESDLALGTYPAAGEFAGAVGVTAVGVDGCGVYAVSKHWIGLWAETSGAGGAAIGAQNRAGGTGPSAGAGIRVLAGTAANSDLDTVGTYRAAGEFAGAVGVVAVGVDGDAVHATSSLRNGVYGYSAYAGATGVYGENPSGYALYSQGLAGVNGDLNVTGAVNKSGGTFKIDHPLDPSGKFLYHSFVESPDMKNVYDGVVTLDAAGTATIDLPDWFESLNRDYRYQLTAMGSAAPNLHVSGGVAGNRFSVAGGKAGQQVSWQVTGIRKDVWAEANRVQVEVAKTGEDQGLYLHPELHGQPASKGIEHAFHVRSNEHGATQG